MLECFYRLRQRIGSTEGLFGIHDTVVLAASASLNDDDRSLLLARLAEKRWAIYVARAVDRFHAWVLQVAPNQRMMSVQLLAEEGHKGMLCEPTSFHPPLDLHKDNMPPADVSMVWHAYMLNPRAYLEDCLRFGRLRLWHTRFPWQAAAEFVNSETFAYKPGQGAKGTFEHMTSIPYDNLSMKGERVVECPACYAVNRALWTTCVSDSPKSSFESLADGEAIIDGMLASGHGYCDKGLELNCLFCSKAITHERLAARRYQIRKLKPNFGL